MGVGGIEIIDTMKESVSGPQNDQMFSKNLGHGSPHQGPTSLSSQSLLLNVSTWRMLLHDPPLFPVDSVYPAHRAVQGATANHIQRVR